MLATACFCLPAEAQGIDPLWLERLTTEGQAAYDRFAALARKLEERCEFRTEAMPGAGRLVFRMGLRREWIVRLRDSMIVEDARLPDQGTPQIKLECDNPDYHFSLGKMREEGDHAMLGYEVGARKTPLVKDLPGIAYGSRAELRGLLEAAQEKDGKRITALGLDKGRGLLRAATAQTFQGEVYEREVWLDPVNGWRVVEVSSSTRWNSGSNRYAYGTVVEGVHLPSAMEDETSYKGPDAPRGMIIKGKVLSIGTTKRTEDGFRLSAFGFPEPPEFPARPKPWGWHIWLLGSAAVCAALSLGFVYLRRRWAGEARP
ncbi:MAG: hypothetical protein K2W96_09765 [Gemmataceae bacterium]|nr:hypothetical protein [Gemmataceae bacterium]